MTLRQKFLVLLGAMALAVVGVSVASVWSLTTLERQIAGPIEDTTAVLRSLAKIASLSDSSIELLKPPTRSAIGVGMGRPTAEVATELTRLNERLRIEVDGLGANSSNRVQLGISTTRALRSSADEAVAFGERWTESGNALDAAQSLESWTQLGRLSDRLLVRVLEDARLAGTFGEELQQSLLFVLGLAVGVFLLVGVLATVLFRRWLLAPIERLRIATERIGSGDLIHRVEIPGSDELARLGSEINEMASLIQLMQTEAIDRERLAAVGEVARGLAHNIRNPIAGIRMMAELSIAQLPDDARGTTIAGHQRRIIQTVDRFERWVTELLGATAPMTLDRRTVAVRPLLEDAAASHAAMAGGKGVEFAISCEVGQVSLDPRLVGQAIAALVANAIQHGPSGSRIKLEASGQRRTLVLRVIDQGAGVPAELAHRIFSPAFTTRSGGTGMGLALARAIARAHGGEITVEPTTPPHGADPEPFGPGATFVMEIPGAIAGG